MSHEHAPSLAEPVPGETRPRIDGRFTPLALLGRGGMAEVFRVRDEVTGRELALKRLRRERAVEGELPLAQFEREYHTLTQLHHPSVIQVFDYVVGAEGAYYTMELLDGEDLRQRGKLPFMQVCAVLGDLISVLALLHSRRWLHRDLSPRNVVCTRAGVTKLIDFGAMAPMGVARNVVGTPPYLPPEALQQLALDARADLYAFGALAYRLLTGRNAYPARTFSQLTDIWRTRPTPPEKLAPDTPPALSRLVLELLSMERGARPGTASEVMERLDALSGGEVRPRADARASYLATPKLVGRERALVKSRRHLVRSLQGHGSGMLLEGPPGVGRSRFLDVCVLEAKLLGATVLRADGSDGARGDYGVARSLGEQLLSALPDLALQSARLLLPVLSWVIPGLAEGHAPPAEGAERPERRHLQTALRDWFRNVARNKRVVIAIDDLERIDEPSAALLSTLTHRSDRRKLIVVATVGQSARRDSAIDLFAQIAEHVQLTPLSQGETEALLQSVFGTTPNLGALAQYIHGLSQGNPRQIMQLAEHLVSSGHARYTGGSWTLPERLTSGDLPASIDAALNARLARLQGDAYALAQTLALTDPSGLSLEDYASLLRDGTHARAFEAIGELVSADILEPEGERYRFSHPSWPELLAKSITPEQRPVLHGRLLPLAARFRDAVELPYHLMYSGQEQRAIELLIARRARGMLTLSVRSIRLHELALKMAERLALPARLRLELRLGMVLLGGVMGELELFRTHVAVALPALEEASGLADFIATDDLPDAARSARARARAQARHDALPEAERTLAPHEALRELAWLVVSFDALARITLDASLCAQMPWLHRFAPDSRLTSIMHRGQQALQLMFEGRVFAACERKREVLEQVRRDDHALRGDPMHEGALAGLTALVAGEQASWARPQTLGYINTLLLRPQLRSAGWRARSTLYLMQGNAVDARHSLRRAQLLALQDHTRDLPPNQELAHHALGYILSDDLNGLKQLIDPIERLADRYPRWRPVFQLVRVHHLRLSGDIIAALQLAEDLRSREHPGAHLISCWISSAQVWLLLAAGDGLQATERGLQDVAAFRGRACDPSDFFDLACATAQALATVGRPREAAELADAVIADMESKQIGGILLGACYETRARVARLAGDRVGFEAWHARCAHLYNAHDNPALSAKFARLSPLSAAGTSLAPDPGCDVAASEDDDPYQATEWSRMAECIGPQERARCALSLLLEHSGASEGHLYGLIEGRLEHLASLPAPPTDNRLREFLEYKIAAELAAEDTTGGNDCIAPEGMEALHRTYRSVVLTANRDGEPLVAAIAAVARGSHSGTCEPSVLSILAESLLEYDDVDPITQLL